MIGTIFIEGLKIDCVIGIYPHERVKEQTLIVDCALDRDFAAAAMSDHVKDTVDYVHLADALTNLAKTRKYKLLETFAEEGAALVIREFAAARVGLKIMKPGAVPRANWPAVYVERRP